MTDGRPAACSGEQPADRWQHRHPEREVTQFPYIDQTNIPNFPVTAGQTVSCSVQYINNKTAGLLYMLNVITNQHFSITLEPPTGAAFNGSSMEWIREAPGGGEPISSLPKFTPVNFTVPWGAARTARRAAIPRTAISRTSSMLARLSRRSRLRLTRRPSRSPANHVQRGQTSIALESFREARRARTR